MNPCSRQNVSLGEILLNMRRLILITTAIIIGSYILAMGVLYFFQDQFTFQAKTWPVEKSYQHDQPFEEVWLKTADSKYNINGLHFKTRQSNCQGVILYFHGNRGNLQRWGKYADPFLKLGYDFFAIDYPGYGKSEGAPSEKAFYESAEAAYDWTAEKYPVEKIVLYGRSIGTGPASYLAAKFPAKQLILETPFASFPDLYDNHWFLKWMPIESQVEFPVKEHLKVTEIPYAIFMGTKDRVVPNVSTLKMKSMVTPPKNFITIPNGKHNNLSEFPKYHEELTRLLTT